MKNIEPGHSIFIAVIGNYIGLKKITIYYTIYNMYILHNIL